MPTPASSLQEFCERLRPLLLMEARLKFANAAVVGGLDAWILAYVEQSLDAFDNSAQTRRKTELQHYLERLHHLWQRYDGADTAYRHEIIDTSHKLLSHLETELQKMEVAPQAAIVEEVAPTVVEDKSSNPPKPRTQTPAPKFALDHELTFLKGVGPKRAAVLAKLGLNTVYDLLYHFPARYEDRRNIKPIAQAEVGDRESFCATVLFPPESRKMGGRSLTRVRVGDSSGRADLQWWNQPWRDKQFQPGMQLFIFGKVNQFNGMLQIDSPEFEFLGENDTLQVGRIVPVYPMTEGLFQTALRRAVMTALEKCVDGLEEALPETTRRQHDLWDLASSLRQIHFPDSFELLSKARKRLLFEELFLLQIALVQKKYIAQVEELGIRHTPDTELIKAFVARLPFKLTGAQKRVMNEIRKDLKSPRPMNRLLHGDVGSGKTMVAAYALWTAHSCGYQGALLAPTELLAEQHYTVLKRLLEPHGVEVALLQGSLKSRDKRNILAGIAEGRCTVVVGTHAIIQEGVQFYKLGVCVVDEQHRFGVLQRAALRSKGHNGLRPDVLVMTATPIPRTLALTLYGDLDVSVLDELPPGRQPIKTVLVKSAQRERAYKYIMAEVKKGRQAYVVCPLIEESENLIHLKAATALAERLREQELHGLRVGLLHGQLTVAEREAEMELFRIGMRDVLVSTTILEVGVDVPNATVMLVEDAERFGLSQLHQLRGRVGRGQFPSTCVLLGNPKTDEARARLAVMKQTQDGFLIADQDLGLRGPGEFYGTRQSGMPDLRLADIRNDLEMITLAREAAQALVDSDPRLQAPQHQALQHALARFWGQKTDLIQVS